MLDHRGFSAYITANGLELVEFEPRVNQQTHTATCWIDGPAGQVRSTAVTWMSILTRLLRRSLSSSTGVTTVARSTAQAGFMSTALRSLASSSTDAVTNSDAVSASPLRKNVPSCSPPSITVCTKSVECLLSDGPLA